MRLFTDLISRLDQSNKTRDKVAALVDYFQTTAPEDAVWVLYLLYGNKLPLRIPARRLREWATELSGLPEWLVDESYERVGDLAETAALILPNPAQSSCHLGLAEFIETRLLPLQHWDNRFQWYLFKDVWLSLTTEETFVVNKLLTGGFRLGVSRNLLIRGLAEAFGLERSVLAHRLMGTWSPNGEFYLALISGENDANSPSRPYPFYLAAPIEKSPPFLGDPNDWLAEWKWDGIRAQMIKRDGKVFLWSRGDEPLTENFPEIAHAAASLNDGTVLDGEILCWKNNRPLPFHVLQTRIRRLNITPEILRDAPGIYLSYDCLEFEGEDIRKCSQTERRAKLQSLFPKPKKHIRLSPLIAFEDWKELESKQTQSRRRGVEGIMLKHRKSEYETGRVKGNWWKWKIDPYTVDLVLIYAQAGHGRRASLFTDYTLAVWQEERLVPVAKAYSGLKNDEIRSLDCWIKANTLARRGPVRTVPPHHVFEIAFEGIRPSQRHKSGVALRFPRIIRWRKDKTPEEADSLGNLLSLLS